MINSISSITKIVSIAAFDECLIVFDLYSLIVNSDSVRLAYNIKTCSCNLIVPEKIPTSRQQDDPADAPDLANTALDTQTSGRCQTVK